ncbi:hypothetical protein ACFL5U_01835 [Candidatus Margulisiibacteriota bacterium]
MSHTIKTDHVYFDYSRQSIDDKTLELLIKLANEKGLEHKIKAMFAGEKINETEKRYVLHVALRGDNPDVAEVLAKIEKFAAGNSLRNIVAIGIGGPYLGPEYLATALRP